MAQLAIDYHGAGVFRERHYDPPAPAADEVQIAVAYTGICGTDLTISKGAMDGRVTSPWPIGHEMSGTIAEVGSIPLITTRKTTTVCASGVSQNQS